MIARNQGVRLMCVERKVRFTTKDTKDTKFRVVRRARKVILVSPFVSLVLLVVK